MGIPNPNPNIADGIKCDNKTYSSNKIESLISTATELPIPAAGDEGKVLTVNAAHDGYELDTPVAPTSIIDDSAAGLDTVYSSSKVESLIPTVPTLTTLSASDFFDDDTDITSFVAYTYGNIVIIQRLAIGNVTYTGGNDKHIKVKDAYKPALSIRISVDDGTSNNCARGFLSDEGYIATNGITSASTSLFAYAFTYVKP